MSEPTTSRELLDLLRHSAVVPEDRVSAYLRGRRAVWKHLVSANDAATQLLADGLISNFQAQQLLRGKHRGFWIKKYIVLEILGSGGMGQVMLCEQTPMNRLVAVKVLTDVPQPGAVERFQREARAVAALDHANIVRAIDIDAEERFHFLVMEYVDGINLQDLIAKHGRLKAARACHYIMQAALGLQHAHEAGWVHRDVKPGNLLVDRSGVVKILDLGLARLSTDSNDQLTKQFDELAVIGTADYIAPEQSLPGQIIDARADIYNLGGTLYFLLTGKTPFGEGSVLQKIMAHQLKAPPAITLERPDLPRELVVLVERMMEKSPARRPQTAREVADALRSLAPADNYPLLPGEYAEHCPRVRQLLLAARPKTPTVPRSMPRAPRRRPPMWLLVAVPLVLLAALGGGVLWWVLANSGITNSKAAPLPKSTPAEYLRGILTPEEALRNPNKVCTVQMVVRSANLSKKAKKLFLNSQTNHLADNNLTIVVQQLDRSNPDELEKLPGQYVDKTIRVTGQVTDFKTQRQIVLPDLASVAIVVEAAKKK